MCFVIRRIQRSAALEIRKVNEERLRAVLEGLECQQIDKLMTMPPDVLRAVAKEIALAARLGAPLYQARPTTREERE